MVAAIARGVQTQKSLGHGGIEMSDEPDDSPSDVFTPGEQVEGLVAMRAEAHSIIELNGLAHRPLARDPVHVARESRTTEVGGGGPESEGKSYRACRRIRGHPMSNRAPKALSGTCLGAPGTDWYTDASCVIRFWALSETCWQRRKGGFGSHMPDQLRFPCGHCVGMKSRIGMGSYAGAKCMAGRGEAADGSTNGASAERLPVETYPVGMRGNEREKYRWRA